MNELTKNRNKAGHICCIDNLGRIVIPSTMRKTYDIEKGEQLELIGVENGILLRKYQPGCMFCGSMYDITLFEGKIVCKDCIEKMASMLK